MNTELGIFDAFFSNERLMNTFCNSKANWRNSYTLSSPQTILRSNRVLLTLSSIHLSMVLSFLSLSLSLSLVRPFLYWIVPQLLFFLKIISFLFSGLWFVCHCIRDRRRRVILLVGVIFSWKWYYFPFAVDYVNNIFQRRRAQTFEAFRDCWTFVSKRQKCTLSWSYSSHAVSLFSLFLIFFNVSLQILFCVFCL